MENNFKLRISKMFQSSFNSCRTKHISDVANQPFFFPENRHHRQLIDLFSPKPHTHFTSSSKPTPHFQKQTTPTQKNHSPTPTLPTHKSSVSQKHQKNPKTAKKKKTHTRKPSKTHSFQSITDNYYYDCYTSSEDDDTLFSSKSFSSDSSASLRKRKPSKTGRCNDRKATDVIPLKLKGKGKFVKDSVAIVKKSSDPHEDFRVSMLEMIVERQLFGVKDLENLLQCFVSLNSEQHHKVIFEVFAEIWETLFSDWF